MTKFTDVRGCLVERIDCVSVCRAGGKPSTGFPPETRSGTKIHISSSMLIHGDVFNLEFQNENEFSEIFLKFSEFSSFFHHFGKSILWSFIEAGSRSERSEDSGAIRIRSGRAGPLKNKNLAGRPGWHDGPMVTFIRERRELRE